MKTQNAIPTPDTQVIKCEGRTKLFLACKATTIYDPCSYGKKVLHIKIRVIPHIKVSMECRKWELPTLERHQRNPWAEAEGDPRMITVLSIQATSLSQAKWLKGQVSFKKSSLRSLLPRRIPG